VRLRTLSLPFSTDGLLTPRVFLVVVLVRGYHNHFLIGPHRLRLAFAVLGRLRGSGVRAFSSSGVSGVHGGPGGYVASEPLRFKDCGDIEGAYLVKQVGV